MSYLIKLIPTEFHSMEWKSCSDINIDTQTHDRGKPMLAYHWEKKFQYSVVKYNKTYMEELPKITPHVCRHTYCSNMAKSGCSVKTLQYLMGTQISLPR